VRDVSTAGARLEFLGALPNASDNVVIDFELADGRMLGVRLAGRITYLTNEPEFAIGGVEFLHPDALRSALVALLADQTEPTIQSPTNRNP
jgi:hypothetical protein